MKLFTKPRLLPPRLLRPGDQLAAIRRGRAVRLVATEVEYVDADLKDKLVWTVVHDATMPEGSVDWFVSTSHGLQTVKVGLNVVAREVIEIDPWTYVRPAEQTG